MMQVLVTQKLVVQTGNADTGGAQTSDASTGGADTGSRTIMYKTGVLRHCGIMANYRCTAACRHCLYACSPSYTDGYISDEVAEHICGILNRGRCRSVHIGGGEPFLDFNGLVSLIRTLNRHRIAIDYIETNAFWSKYENTAREWLRALLKLGIDTLCISVDPFHNEYVPLEGPLRLCALCDMEGMGYFLWKQQYLKVLAVLNTTKSHTRKEFESALSKDYISKTAQSYGIGYGGRAVNIEEEYGKYKNINELLNKSPCKQLLGTGHFHVDFLGNFIPPGCTGFAIPLEEAYGGIVSGKYPVFEALYNGGISSLFDLAASHGFVPDKKGYPSSCNLCFHIRRWICESENLQVQLFAPELDSEHYRQALMYY